MTITSPAEGIAVSPSDSLNVAWTGSITNNVVVVRPPYLILRTYNSQNNCAPDSTPCGPYAPGSATVTKVLNGNESSATISVPSVTQPMPSTYLLELRIFGDNIDRPEGTGLCAMTRRVKLVRK